MHFYRNCCLLLIATLVICAPLSAAPTASVSTVTFQYSQGGQVTGGAPQGITTTGVTNVTARISQNIDTNGNQVNAAAPNNAAGVFQASNGNPVGVGVDNSILPILAAKGQNNYAGTMQVSSSNCSEPCLSISLNLQIGSNGQITVTAGGVVIPAAGITLTAAPGATPT